MSEVLLGDRTTTLILMCLSQSSRISSHKKTVQLVRDCVRETNYLAKERFANALKQRKGKISQIRRFLFLHPTRALLLILALTTVVFLISYLIILNLINVLWVRLLFILTFGFFYIAITIFVPVITPKFNMEWEERWGQVLNSYLHKIALTPAQAELSISEQQELRLNKAEFSLKKAILYYRRKAKPINIIIKLLFGGIFIGCLPDPDFQKALITMSPSVIWNTNPLGAISILILPCICLYYSVIYDLPIAWMEQVENGSIIIPKEYQQELSQVEPVKIVISNKVQTNTAEAWAKWFESVEQLEATSTETPVKEYQQLLLEKYRQQGLEL